MKSSAIVLTALLLAGAAASPAIAAGLLGGVSGAIGSATGSGASSGSTSGVGVQGVATANANASNSGTTANATLLGGGGSTINAGLDSVVGSTSDVGATLPGTGDSPLDTPLGDTTDAVNGLASNGGTAGTTLDNSGLSGNSGGLGDALGGNGGLLGSDDGDNGNGLGLGLGDRPTANLDTGPATGVGADAGGITTGAGAGNLAGLLGSYAGNPACRQDTAALGQLLRTSYNSRNASQWARSSGVQLVRVPVCAQARGAVGRIVSGSPNLYRMQAMAAADPLISTSLSRLRISANHVLGVGQTGGSMTVYVY